MFNINRKIKRIYKICFFSRKCQWWSIQLCWMLRMRIIKIHEVNIYNVNDDVISGWLKNDEKE